MTDYTKLTVAKLKVELEKRDLVTTGKKANLVARLEENDAESSSSSSAKAEAPPAAAAAAAAEAEEEGGVEKAAEDKSEPSAAAPIVEDSRGRGYSDDDNILNRSASRSRSRSRERAKKDDDEEDDKKSNDGGGAAGDGGHDGDAMTDGDSDDLKKCAFTDEELTRQLQIRWDARLERNWPAADEVRNAFKEVDISLNDRNKSWTW